MVDIALEEAPVSECPAGDANHDGKITIDEIILAENNALNGCMMQTSLSPLGGWTPLNETRSICPVAWSAAPHPVPVPIREAGFVEAGRKVARPGTQRSERPHRPHTVHVGNLRPSGYGPREQST